MNDSEIQIQFERPGEWARYSMTALWQDAAGYRHQQRHTPADVEASGHADALAAVVASLVGLAEPWQAVQVWARLGCEAIPPAAEGGESAGRTFVGLTVEAKNAGGGYRCFTPADYPEFRLCDAGALAFFKHFTTGH